MTEKAVPQYDDTATYTVRVSRPVKVGPFKYLPRDEPQMTGQHLNRLVQENGPDAITSAEPI